MSMVVKEATNAQEAWDKAVRFDAKLTEKPGMSDKQKGMIHRSVEKNLDLCQKFIDEGKGDYESLG